MSDITQEFDQTTGVWKEVGRGAAFRPNEGGTQENWGQPVSETDPHGNPIVVRYGARGGRQVVSGAVPKGATVEPNVDQAKNNQLYNLTVKQLPVAEKHFDDLASMKNTIPRALAGGLNTLTLGTLGPSPSTVTGSSGRLGENAIRDIVTNFTYSVSGATAPPQEIDDKMRLVTPFLTDPQSVKDEKKQRLRNMVESIRQRTAGKVAPMPDKPSHNVNFEDLP
jgi:hypothetical protein